MRESISFCGKQNNKYSSFFSNKLGVKSCGFTESEIIQVKVRESIDNENPIYFAWWSNKENKFQYTNSNRLGVEICFPYGSKIEVEAGNGEIVKVTIEEIQL